MSDTIDLYEQLLAGKRQRFPRGTWNPLKGGHDNYRKVIRYLVLDKLKLDREFLTDSLTYEWLDKYGLRKGLEYTFVDLYSLVENCFQEFQIQPWELHYNPKRQQTNPVEIIRWLISEKLGWNREDIVYKFSGNTLREHGLYKIYSTATGGKVRIFELLDEAFPEYHFDLAEFRWSRERTNHQSSSSSSSS